MSVSMKPFDVQVHEINVKINTLKIGDGLILGYVPRRTCCSTSKRQENTKKREKKTGFFSVKVTI